HNDGSGVAAGLAVVQRGLRNGQRDRITQMLAREELRARGRRDGAGEGDEGEADCGHESILQVAAVFCFGGNSAAPKSIPFRTACIRRGSKAARADKPPCKSNRPALTVRRRADVSAAFDPAQCASGSGRSWICTARGLLPLPPSISQGV